MDRGSSVRAVVEAAEAYELVLSLATAADESERSPAGPALRRAAGPDLLRRVRAVSTSSWMWAHLLSAAHDSPPPRDAAALLAFVEALPALELQRRLVGYYVRWFRHATPAETMDGAARGRPAAIREFIATSYPHDRAWQRALAARLRAGATAAKRELLWVLERWHDDVFVPHVAPSMPALKAAAGRRRRSRAEAGSEEWISSVLGWDYVAEPGIARVLLIPSHVIGPQTHEFEHEQLKIICFPAGLAATAQGTMPADTAATLRALADPQRLRIVERLASEDLGAQALADALGIRLNTVLHHLGVLRRAGAVTNGGRRQAYRLDRARVSGAGAALQGLATSAGQTKGRSTPAAS